MSSLHELYPNIPLGTPIRSLVHTELGAIMARGAILDEKLRLGDFLRQDRMKGIPLELLALEIEVADWAYAEEAADRGTLAELLDPEPGYLLPGETLRRLQERERIAIRTLVYSRDLGEASENYYRTPRGRNPILGGEVADYLGVALGESVELALGAGGDTARLSRSADGVVQLTGLGDYLAERGGGGEVWLEFGRDRTLRWSPVGFWLKMDGEPWDQYQDAVVRIDFPAGVIEFGAAPGLARSMGMGASGFRDPIGEFPLADDEHLHVITAYDSSLDDGAANQRRNAELLAAIEALGATWYPAVGADRTRTHQEPSFAVLGLSRDQAIALGWKYRQDAIFEWTRDYWALVDCRFGYVMSMRWESRTIGVGNQHGLTEVA